MSTSNSKTRELDLKHRLSLLTIEHRSLDQEIENLSARASTNQLELRRMKKRKLKLKDEIELIKSALIPDLNA